MSERHTSRQCFLCERWRLDCKQTEGKDGWMCRRCSEAADAASEQDREYFEQHPDQHSVYRAALPHEWPQFPPHDDAMLMVEVTQLGPGLRTRRSFWLVSS